MAMSLHAPHEEHQRCGMSVVVRGTHHDIGCSLLGTQEMARSMTCSLVGIATLVEDSTESSLLKTQGVAMSTGWFMAMSMRYCLLKTQKVSFGPVQMGMAFSLGLHLAPSFNHSPKGTWPQSGSHLALTNCTWM